MSTPWPYDGLGGGGHRRRVGTFNIVLQSHMLQVESSTLPSLGCNMGKGVCIPHSTSIQYTMSRQQHMTTAWPYIGGKER